jgi:hypothetical protein
LGKTIFIVFQNHKIIISNLRGPPDKTVTELFGHNTDGKWANILYVGQIAEKDIQAFENNTRLRNKVSRTIDGSNQIQFQNEIFCINKVR